MQRGHTLTQRVHKCANVLVCLRKPSSTLVNLRRVSGCIKPGSDVSSAGDINGDGLDDLIVAALGNDEGGANAGKAYIIFSRL